MRIFIIFVSALFLATSVHAQTTVTSHVDAPGTDNDGVWQVTYNTGTFDSFLTQIDDTAWWTNEAAAQAFATAFNVNNLKFAYGEFDPLATDYALFSDNTTSVGNGGSLDTTTSAVYAITAVNVPAPLPILGILPIIGFLKRMRKRQRA